VNAYIFDETVTNELQSIFESDKQKSTLLTPDNWKKRRSFKRRFMGWLYHFLAPLI
jgi:cardiolipin synthase